MPMSLREGLHRVVALFGPRKRRVWVGTKRAHMEYRDLDADELVAFRKSVVERLSALSGVAWVEVNPYTHRVVVAFETPTIDAAQVERAVFAAEHEACCAAASFSAAPTPHPADVETLTRLAVEVAADVVGLLVGTTLRALPIGPSRAGAALASTLTVVEILGPLAQALRRLLGPRTHGCCLESVNRLRKRPGAATRRIGRRRRAQGNAAARSRSQTWSVAAP